MKISTLLHQRYTTLLLAAFVSACLLTKPASALDASAVRMSADAAITEVWIDGVSIAPKTHASDWRQADDYGSHSNLRCVAVRATDDGAKVDNAKWAAFIATIVVSNDLWVTSDYTWKAWAGTPPLDGAGREWTDPEYDDSSWPAATEVGAYGCGPYGTNDAGPYFDGSTQQPAESQLDAAFRIEEQVGPSDPWSGDSYFVQNATWIWAGLGLNPNTSVCLRKRFDGGDATPTRPQDLRVTSVSSTGFSLEWNQAFSPGGDVTYQVVWNGLVIETTSDTSCSIDGLSISPFPQNYAYVRAVAPDGTKGKPSRTVLIKTQDTQPPGAVPNFRILDEVNGRIYFAWDHATDNVGIESYRFSLNSWVYVVPGHLTECSIKPGFTLTEDPTIKAGDLAGNYGPETAATSPAPVTSSPVAPEPEVYATGETLIMLRWVPGPTGSCSGYRVQQQDGGSWTTVDTINDPRHGEIRISDLTPNTTYTFRVTALGNGENASSDPITASTIDPSTEDSLLRFGVVMSTDGEWDYLEAALQDAVDAGCAFTVVKGQLVDQLSGLSNKWNRLRQIGDTYSGNMDVLFSPLASKDQYPIVRDPTLSWPSDAWPSMSFMGRFDRFLHHIEQPLNRVYTALDGALHMATFAERPRGNRDFILELERAFMEAEADPACKWFLTSGNSTESYPRGLSGILPNLYRPSVEFMRMINGNPGYEINWIHGRNVVGTSPARNRKGGWYFIDVEDTRLVIRTRKQLTDGTIEAGAIKEIQYDRASNYILPSDLRIAYSSGKSYGRTLPPPQGPVWTQNRIVTTSYRQSTTIQLMGRSSRGEAVNYTITQQPAHGTLTGMGNLYTYQPEPGFAGEDYFLYRADDGGSLTGNTAWVKIQVVGSPASSSHWSLF